MKIRDLVVNPPRAVRRPARSKQGPGLVLVDSITEQDSKRWAKAHPTNFCWCRNENECNDFSNPRIEDEILEPGICTQG